METISINSIVANYFLNNPEETKAKGERSYRRAMKEYNWDDVSNNIINLYHGLLK